jgi:hypothetical protein
MKVLGKISILVAALAVAVLSACSGPGDGSSSSSGSSSLSNASSSSAVATISGSWLMGMTMMGPNGFAITNGRFIEYDYIQTNQVRYAGKIVNNPDLSANNGLIVIQVTNTGDGMSAATNGTFIVGYWTNFSGGTVVLETYSQDSNGNEIFYATSNAAAADSPVTGDLINLMDYSSYH